MAAAGYGNQGDLLYLERLGPSSIRIGFLVSGMAPRIGPALQFDASSPHTVEVIFGSLLPPKTSPAWADSIEPERRAQLKRQVLVQVDGRNALQASEDTPEAAPSTVAAGQNSVGFSGIIPTFGDGLTLSKRDSLDDTVDTLVRNAVKPD